MEHVIVYNLLSSGAMPAIFHQNTFFTLRDSKMDCIMYVFAMIFIVIGICIEAAYADSPLTLNNIYQKLEERNKQLCDIRFTYNVETNLIDSMVLGTKSEDDMSIRKREETFSILHSNDDANPLPLVAWFVRYEKKGRTPMASFFVYDGRNCYRFVRGEPVMENVIPVNFGIIDTGYNNLFMVENYFERILFLKPNGASQNLDSIEKSTSSKDYKYIRDTVWNGKKAFVYQLERVQGIIFNEVIVILEPCCMVVGYKTISFQTKKTLMEMKIDKLDSFEGLTYPSRGGYSESESGRSYTFHVTSVERLTEQSRSEWQPKWPGGTDVRDRVNNIVFTVKRSEVEESKISQKKETQNTEIQRKETSPTGIQK